MGFLGEWGSGEWGDGEVGETTSYALRGEVGCGVWGVGCGVWGVGRINRNNLLSPISRLLSPISCPLTPES